MEFNAAPIQVVIRDLETMTCQFIQGGKPIDPAFALAAVACGVFSIDVKNNYAEVEYRPETHPFFIAHDKTRPLNPDGTQTLHIFEGRSVVLVVNDIDTRHK